jgi:hypothetical protein
VKSYDNFAVAYYIALKGWFTPLNLKFFPIFLNYKSGNWSVESIDDFQFQCHLKALE